MIILIPYEVRKKRTRAIYFLTLSSTKINCLLGLKGTIQTLILASVSFTCLHQIVSSSAAAWNTTGPWANWLCPWEKHVPFRHSAVEPVPSANAAIDLRGVFVPPEAGMLSLLDAPDLSTPMTGSTIHSHTHLWPDSCTVGREITTYIDWFWPHLGI